MIIQPTPEDMKIDPQALLRLAEGKDQDGTTPIRASILTGLCRRLIAAEAKLAVARATVVWSAPAGAGPLTERQREVLDFIRSYIAENQIPPTLREIMQAFAITSPNGALFHLDVLERKGYITRQRGKSRTLRLVNGG